MSLNLRLRHENKYLVSSGPFEAESVSQDIDGWPRFLGLAQVWRKWLVDKTGTAK